MLDLHVVDRLPLNPFQIVKSTVEGNEIITGNATPGRFLVDVFPSSK